MTREERLEAMLAKDEIRDVMMNYARGVDRFDQDIIKSDKVVKNEDIKKVLASSTKAPKKKAPAATAATVQA